MFLNKDSDHLGRGNRIIRARHSIELLPDLKRKNKALISEHDRVVAHNSWDKQMYAR